MSVVDKAVRVAYEWYKRNFGPPQPPPPEPQPPARSEPAPPNPPEDRD